MNIFIASCPMLVPISDKGIDNDWDKFDSLSDEKRNILSSQKTASTIEGISKRFNLSVEDAAAISRVIKLFFFEYLSGDDIERELSSQVPALGNNLHYVADVIKKEIIFSDPREHNDEARSTFNEKTETKETEMSLNQAMQKYPNLGEQLLTSYPIRLKIFPQPVRASIKNWIEDYRSVMGAERHGMMERGNYLFHTENARRLTSGDRKKLAEILRSLDEDVTLKIDPGKQEVIFEQVEEVKAVDGMPNQAFVQSRPLSGGRITDKARSTEYKMPDAGVRFSSPHVLPGEKKVESPSASFQQSPNYTSRQDLGAKPAPPRMDSKVGFANPKAGKPWEPASPASPSRGEPKVDGNTVDLRN